MTAGRASGVPQWLQRRRLRYRAPHDFALDDIRDDLKTGDIILFHKSSRNGLLDTLEMDFLAPLFYRETEFRHCGIVVRDEDSLSVIECADELHSGHHIARYPWGGTGIREVPLEPLLQTYARDNESAHFGVRFIPQEIPADALMAAVGDIGPVSYLRATRSATIYLSQFLLPERLFQKLVAVHASQMMCSEFVHAVLARCGALRDFTSKVFAPYIIENTDKFRDHDAVGYSDIVRFAYPT